MAEHNKKELCPGCQREGNSGTHANVCQNDRCRVKFYETDPSSTPATYKN